MQIWRGPLDAFRWRRSPGTHPEAAAAVQQILADVRRDGDAALRRWTATLDGVDPAGVPDWPLVREDALARAWSGLSETLRAALTEAAARIRAFHERQLPRDDEDDGPRGERLGVTWRPIRRVGVYVPGGRAAYPSTVLMNVIPAQVAGVSEIALASPPGPDGQPHPLVLAAAHLLGVRTVYAVGGAQAIAAFAAGTATIAPVDKIVGPGNLYVALAKRAVMGEVGIDSIAGPTEVFIVAGPEAPPNWTAADLLAQAEHDTEAGAVVLSPSPGFLDAVAQELDRQLVLLPRRTIAEAALAHWGALVHVPDLEAAVAAVNEAAPEHVELLLPPEEAFRWLPRIDRAGAVFLGPYTPEAVGDYFAGPNHTLPTHGTARYASGLGVHDFLRRMTYVAYTADTLAVHAAAITALAEAEGLAGHARSVTVRVAGPSL
jgi:histidinol dehydrogenase